LNALNTTGHEKVRIDADKRGLLWESDSRIEPPTIDFIRQGEGLLQDGRVCISLEET